MSKRKPRLSKKDQNIYFWPVEGYPSAENYFPPRKSPPAALPVLHPSSWGSTKQPEHHRVTGKCTRVFYKLVHPAASSRNEATTWAASNLFALWGTNPQFRSGWSIISKFDWKELFKGDFSWEENIKNTNSSRNLTHSRLITLERWPSVGWNFFDCSAYLWNKLFSYLYGYSISLNFEVWIAKWLFTSRILFLRLIIFFPLNDSINSNNAAIFYSHAKWRS